MTLATTAAIGLAGDHASLVSVKNWLQAGTISGILAAGSTLQITMTNFSMPLNNDGDSIELIDSNGNVVNQVVYQESDVNVGVMINF